MNRRHAYELLRAESSIWAMASEHVEALASMMVAGGSLPTRRAAESSNRGATAVIPIMGPLTRRSGIIQRILGTGTAGSFEGIAANVSDALANKSVSRLLLWVDSPGGVVTGLPELADAIRAANRIKPVISFVDGLAASAAYWLAAQAGHVSVTPSGEVGSIGVFQLHLDHSRALEMEGVKPTFIFAGRFKTEGNPLQPLTDEAQLAIQGDVDTFFRLFLDDVARGRRTSVKNVTAKFGQGRMVLAAQAHAVGMVDSLGSFEQAIAGSSRALPDSARRGTLESYRRRLAIELAK